MLGVSTGGRISELLSLRIADVYQNGKAVTDLLFDKSIVKGKEMKSQEAVPVNRDGRQAIDETHELGITGAVRKHRNVNATAFPITQRYRARSGCLAEPHTTYLKACFC